MVESHPQLYAEHLVVSVYPQVNMFSNNVLDVSSKSNPESPTPRRPMHVKGAGDERPLAFSDETILRAWLGFVPFLLLLLHAFSEILPRRHPTLCFHHHCLSIVWGQGLHRQWEGFVFSWCSVLQSLHPVSTKSRAWTFHIMWLGNKFPCATEEPFSCSN